MLLILSESYVSKEVSLLVRIINFSILNRCILIRDKVEYRTTQYIFNILNAFTTIYNLKIDE